ncbi:hypothetical protein MP228_001593 [Amoeboaphelidium protococcarum]|nr:hypothetical protein MP228_001593 [Amoeboaphelidium protococcarum]
MNSLYGTSLPQAWNVFIEKIAEVLALSLTTQETEAILKQVHSESPLTQYFPDEHWNRVKELTLKINEKALTNNRRLEIEKQMKRPFCQHSGYCRSNCFRGFLRAFSAAFIVKYGVSVVQTLLNGKLRSRPRLLWEMLDRDTLRFAAFFGSFIGGFKGILCLLRKVRKVEDRWNSFIAGVISSYALLLDEKSRRIAIALYLSCRSLQCTHAYMVKHGYFPRIPNGEVLLMALCNVQIMHNWMLYPETLSPSYYQWIYNLADLQHFYGKRDAKVAKSVMASIIKKEPVDPSQLARTLQLCREVREQQQQQQFGVSVNAAPQYVICNMFHPHTNNCTWAQLTYAMRCFPKAFKMYLPLNLAMMLLLRHGLLAKDGKKFILRLIVSSTRSSLFITLFASLAWLVPCYFRNYITPGRETTMAYLMNGFVSGCTVLIEQPQSRRLELAMYCLPRAIEGCWNLLRLRLRIKNTAGLSKMPPMDINQRSIVFQAWRRAVALLCKDGMETVAFSMAMGVLLTLFVNEQDTIPSNYQDVMIRFFGIN